MAGDYSWAFPSRLFPHRNSLNCTPETPRTNQLTTIILATYTSIVAMRTQDAANLWYTVTEIGYIVTEMLQIGKVNGKCKSITHPSVFYERIC